MTRRLVLILGLTALLLAPTLASAGQSWRSAWRQEKAEIRREFRNAARTSRLAIEQAWRQRRLDRRRSDRDRWAFRHEYRRLCSAVGYVPLRTSGIGSVGPTSVRG